MHVYDLTHYVNVERVFAEKSPLRLPDISAVLESGITTLFHS